MSSEIPSRNPEDLNDKVRVSSASSVCYQPPIPGHHPLSERNGCYGIHVTGRLPFDLLHTFRSSRRRLECDGATGANGASRGREGGGGRGLAFHELIRRGRYAFRYEGTSKIKRMSLKGNILPSS